MALSSSSHLPTSRGDGHDVSVAQHTTGCRPFRALVTRVPGWRPGGPPTALPTQGRDYGSASPVARRERPPDHRGGLWLVGGRRRWLGVRLGAAGRRAVDRGHPSRRRSGRQLGRHGGRCTGTATPKRWSAVPSGPCRSPSGRSCSPSAASCGTTTYRWPVRRRSSRLETVRQGAEHSLRRLGLDHVDLFQIHWPDDQGHPIEEAWAEMVKLRDEGKARAIGVSNFDPELLGRCEAIGHVDSLQPPFSLISPRRRPARAASGRATHETGVICYSPMESGLLTDTFSAERVAAMADDDWRKRDDTFLQPRLGRNLSLRDALRPIADAPRAPPRLPSPSPGCWPGRASAAPSSAPARHGRSTAGSAARRSRWPPPTSTRSRPRSHAQRRGLRPVRPAPRPLTPAVRPEPTAGNLGGMERRLRLPLLAAGQPCRRDRMAPVGRACLRRGSPSRAPRPAVASRPCGATGAT